MRELLLLAIVFFICVASLVKVQVALYGYVWYGLMRPDILAFAEAKYPISTILAIACAIAMVRRYSSLPAIFQCSASRLLLLMQIPIGLSVLFAVRPELSMERYTDYIKMMAVLFSIPVLIQTEQHFRELILVILMSLGAIGVKFGSFGVLHGGVVLVGGYGDVLDDNNFLALALAMLVPLCWYYMLICSSWLMKASVVGIMGLSIAQVLMSNSRGGSLALGLGLVAILLRTRRRALFLLMALPCVGALLYLVRDTYFERMNTLRVPTEEASAASRLVHAETALKMWTDYPFLGVGFGGFNYAALAPKYGGADADHVAHNSYLQMLVDAGIVAGVLYICTLIASVRILGRSAAKWRSTHPLRAALPTGVQTALLVFMLGGTFYSCHRLDFTYMLMMCAAAWEAIDRRTTSDEMENQVPMENIAYAG